MDTTHKYCTNIWYNQCKARTQFSKISNFQAGNGLSSTSHCLSRTRNIPNIALVCHNWICWLTQHQLRSPYKIISGLLYAWPAWHSFTCSHGPLSEIRAFCTPPLLGHTSMLMYNILGMLCLCGYHCFKCKKIGYPKMMLLQSYRKVSARKNVLWINNSRMSCP